MPSGHLNAMRFDQRPLPQPAYSFVHVPRAKSTLENSSLQRIENREAFQTCMAEMLLLSKEAVRRRKNIPIVDPVVTNSGAKPLSLEYLADRMDIDEPCFGYLVRTNTKPEAAPATTEDQNPSHWKKGMLQGFITVTCFTNWQKSFRFDSLHPEAYSFDSDSLTAQRKNGQRKWDSTGELATALQQTVHKGDIWNEGIVWPRIAEISLLGALGCGRTLVKLALEQLENLKPNAQQNYDYVVLQATDNSIPFYESLGFVRVGGIMEERNEDDEEEEPMSEMVTSEITTYVTKKRGEIPLEIAKKLKIDVWDIIFLNKGVMEAIKPTSRLLLGTALEVPVTPKKLPQVPTRASTRNVPPGQEKEEATANSLSVSTRNETDTDGIEWYNAKENDTPNKIAKMFQVNCQELIKANSPRLPGLVAKSRLKNDTRVQVSHFHMPSKAWTAYAHWSFPERGTESGEPSYVMVYKLKKRAKRKGKECFCPVQTSLQTDMEEYKRTPLLLLPPEEKKCAACVDDGYRKPHKRNLAGPTTTTPPATPVLVTRDTNRDSVVRVKVVSDGEIVKPPPVPPSTSVTTDNHAFSKTPANSLTQKMLKPPKQAVGPFVLFCQDMRKRKKELLEGLSIADASRVLADRWTAAPIQVKQKFEKLAMQAKEERAADKEAYQQRSQELKQMEQQNTPLENRSQVDRVLQPFSDKISKRKKDHKELYNKVVRLKPDAFPFIVRVMPKDEEIIGTDERLENDPTVCPSLQPGKYKFWFCLTYIPDLQWCHLVPMVAAQGEAGEFTVEDKKPRLLGMKKWKLVDERLGQEIDLSSRYVIPVKSRETKKSADANKEEWAIFDQEERRESSGSTKSVGSKCSRKRSRPDSPSKSSCTKKKKKLDLAAGSTQANIRNTNNGSSDWGTEPSSGHPPLTGVEGVEKQKPFQMTLPPMNLDLPLIRQEAKCGSEGSSPHTPGSYPHCLCGSHVPCPAHHPPPLYQYAPYPRYPPPGRRVQPPPGYPPSHPPAHHHYNAPPWQPCPPYHHNHQHDFHPSYAPPLPRHGTPCQPPSTSRLNMSVERDVAL